MNPFGLGTLGAFLGAIAGLITRPPLPVMGQPPIGAAINTLFAPKDEIEAYYQSLFLPNIILWVVGAAVFGAIVGAVLSRRKA
jgi:hypothetical protein